MYVLNVEVWKSSCKYTFNVQQNLYKLIEQLDKNDKELVYLILATHKTTLLQCLDSSHFSSLFLWLLLYLIILVTIIHLHNPNKVFYTLESLMHCSWKTT